VKDNNDEAGTDQTDEMDLCENWEFEEFFAVGRIYAVVNTEVTCLLLRRILWLSDYQFSFVYVRSLV
jgi:hypothetical protein